MQAVKKIGVILVVSMLIMATGGFSVYQHVCHCAGEMTASFFQHENCEHLKAIERKSCCTVKETKSCCAAEPVKEKKHTCHKGDCCNTSIHFFKINDSFQQSFAKVSMKPVVVAETILFVNFSEEIPTKIASNIFGPDISPPDTGREILTALHQLKLDTHLV